MTKRRSEDEQRADERYEEEARHSHGTTPEYQGQHLLFDDMRDEPDDPGDPPEVIGPLATTPGAPASKQELVGEGVGGASGAVIGAAVGSIAGPIGAAVGAIAGAVGGWWAGRAVVDVASGIASEDDVALRDQYERSPHRLADRTYWDVRLAYQLGRIASRNPDYTGRAFEDVERDVAHGWTAELRDQCGEWIAIRGFVREGYLLRDRHQLPGDAR